MCPCLLYSTNWQFSQFCHLFRAISIAYKMLIWMERLIVHMFAYSVNLYLNRFSSRQSVIKYIQLLFKYFAIQYASICRNICMWWAIENCRWCAKWAAIAVSCAFNVSSPQEYIHTNVFKSNQTLITAPPPEHVNNQLFIHNFNKFQANGICNQWSMPKVSNIQNPWVAAVRNSHFMSMWCSCWLVCVLIHVTGDLIPP